MEKSLDSSLKGIGKGEKEMTEGGSHGMLMMGIARHDRQSVFFSPMGKSFHQMDQSFDQF
jgi:hypothetical protein